MPDKFVKNIGWKHSSRASYGHGSAILSVTVQRHDRRCSTIGAWLLSVDVCDWGSGREVRTLPR